MNKITMKTLLIAAAFVSAGNAYALRTSSSVAKPPQIMSTETEIQGNDMVISGHNFGAQEPIVRLGDQVLSVKSHSDNQTIVVLPPQIRPATYRLTITTAGARKLTSDPFNATITSLAIR
ncbi:MAG: IPT/TIG domain-containing protein [Methylococcales bacterium]